LNDQSEVTYVQEPSLALRMTRDLVAVIRKRPLKVVAPCIRAACMAGCCRQRLSWFPR